MLPGHGLSNTVQIMARTVGHQAQQHFLSCLPFFLCNVLISIISIVITIYLNINYLIGGDNADTCCYQMHIYLKK